uniref:Protein Nef n=1 Tax=Human immunodeficiency virus type 1 TaxID=11676 RepID=Q8Q5Y0_HV1|nr:nef protein [Human immunodeficiency virus 1]
MGGKCSKHSFPGWDTIRERMRRTGPRERRNEPPAEGVGAVSRDLEQRGAITTSNTASNNAACAWLEAQEEEEVGFPIIPQVPLRPMTYKGALDLSHFLREKGGLEGLIHSQKRQDILDLWIYHTQGYFPDWQNNNCLLHPINLHGMDDPEGEVLEWRFDSRLAFHHMAREKHPEYFKDC